MSKFDEKGIKILRKTARFLLERYMHPREFFGPAIYKQTVKTKTKENYVDIMQTKDFYLRLKLAGVRKTIKENETINNILCLDEKYGSLLYVKKVVKALEEVAKEEQEKMMEMEAAAMDTANMPGAQMADSYNYTGGPPMPQFGSLSGGLGLGNVGMSGARMYMMNNGLNTIEEEKHETQTSNYFNNGEETDESNIQKSRVLGAILDETHGKPVEFSENHEEKQDKSITEMKSVSDHGAMVEEDIAESPIKQTVVDKIADSYEESADYEF